MVLGSLAVLSVVVVLGGARLFFCTVLSFPAREEPERVVKIGSGHVDGVGQYSAHHLFLFCCISRLLGPFVQSQKKLFFRSCLVHCENSKMSISLLTG